MEKFRLEDLKTRNESGSGEILIGYKGKVYDLSKSPNWKDGVHMRRHNAGEDLTNEMEAAPHGEEMLNRFEPVGELIVDEPIEVLESGATPSSEPGGLLKFVLDQHPHPVTVHFPVALTLTATLFTLIGWIFSSAFFITAGFTNLIVATLATPAAIATGYLSFHHNYGHKWTRTFRLKQILSMTLLGVSILAILIHLIAPGDIQEPGFWLHAYMFLVFLLAPIVGGTGYLGGTITFPR